LLLIFRATPAPAKLTKTAAKKAAKAAREARRQKKSDEAAAPAQQTEPTVPPSNGKITAPSSPTDTLPPPVAAQPEVPEKLPAPEPQAEPPAAKPPVVAPVVPETSVQQPQQQSDAKSQAPKAIPVVPTAPEKKQESTKKDMSPSKATVPAPPAPAPQEAEKVKKRQNIITRTLWTFIMIGGFLGMLSVYTAGLHFSLFSPGLLLLGHVYMIILVMVCQTIVYREVTTLFSLTSSSNPPTTETAKDPWSKTLNWYWFAVTNYFLYGESIIYYFKVGAL
jgi:phosphatidate cytidylyltransferase